MAMISAAVRQAARFQLLLCGVRGLHRFVNRGEHSVTAG